MQDCDDTVNVFTKCADAATVILHKNSATCVGPPEAEMGPWPTLDEGPLVLNPDHRDGAITSNKYTLPVGRRRAEQDVKPSC